MSGICMSEPYGWHFFVLWSVMTAVAVFARKLSKPINILNSVTQQVAGGDLTARVHIRTETSWKLWGIHLTA